jgi:hypothetical protein
VRAMQKYCIFVKDRRMTSIKNNLVVVVKSHAFTCDCWVNPCMSKAFMVITFSRDIAIARFPGGYSD